MIELQSNDQLQKKPPSLSIDTHTYNQIKSKKNVVQSNNRSLLHVPRMMMYRTRCPIP